MLSRCLSFCPVAPRDTYSPRTGYTVLVPLPLSLALAYTQSLDVCKDPTHVGRVIQNSGCLHLISFRLRVPAPWCYPDELRQLTRNLVLQKNEDLEAGNDHSVDTQR